MIWHDMIWYDIKDLLRGRSNLREAVVPVTVSSRQSGANVTSNTATHRGTASGRVDGRTDNK
jgi:hypothetical protein